MKMQRFNLLLIVLFCGIFLQSCMYDARTKSLKRDGITASNSEKGRALLDELWKKQGANKMDKREVYSFDAFDTWQGKLGEMAKIWPDLETNLKFKFGVGTENNQAQFVDGQRAGTTFGRLNDEYYELENGSPLFSDNYAESNIRAYFGLSHFHYYFEILSNLRKAPVIAYAGDEEFNDKHYELVFCTWGSAEPSMENEQFLLWINKETGLLDYIEYSVRETYLKTPGYKLFGAAIEYTDYRDVDGVLIPHDQIVYAIKKKTDREKCTHRVKVTNFQFDAFDSEELIVK